MPPHAQPHSSVVPPVDTVPPAITCAAVAAAARHCEALSRAHRLAAWLGEGRPVTPKHVLRPREVPAAARILGFLGSPQINTAAEVPALHRCWTVALAVGLIQIVDGQAVATSAVEQWLDTGDDDACELWRIGLIAAYGAGSRTEDQAGAAAFCRLMLGALATDPPPSIVEMWERARATLHRENSYTAADPFFSSSHYKHWDFLTAMPELLIEFGAATRRGAQLEMTPLGRWAVQEIHAHRPNRQAL